MRQKTESRLTPRERLTRGLTYTAVGPVDVTRGVLGLGAHTASAGAASVRRRYRESRLARELAAAPDALAAEFAAAQEVVAGLPQAMQEARRSQGRSRRPLLIASVAVGVLATGAVAFSVIRRTKRAQEPSPLPPSVDIHPQP